MSIFIDRLVTSFSCDILVLGAETTNKPRSNAHNVKNLADPTASCVTSNVQVNCINCSVMRRAVIGVTKGLVSMFNLSTICTSYTIQLTFRLVLCHDTVHENDLLERDWLKR